MRVLALDYGGKRTGIAVTDAMQIIANGLTTIDSATLIVFLKKYLNALAHLKTPSLFYNCQSF
mgnify:CR=1 FL=1